MKSHVRNTVRSVLRKGRSRNRSRDPSERDFVYNTPEHPSPFEPPPTTNRHRTDLDSVTHSGLSQSSSRIFGSHHHRGRSGRDIGSSRRDASDDSDRGSEATTAGRWPRRILSRVSRRNKVDEPLAEDESEPWNPFSRRKSRRHRHGGSSSRLGSLGRYEDDDEADMKLAEHTRMNAAPATLHHDEPVTYPRRQTDRSAALYEPPVATTASFRPRKTLSKEISPANVLTPDAPAPREDWSAPPEVLGGNGTPGTESTRATEESPCRDAGVTHADSAEEGALCYSPAESPRTPPLMKGSQNFSPVESLLSSSQANEPGPPGALSAKRTPTDLTQFFYPKPWTPERFRSLKRLASAIHGEVRHVLDLVEKKHVVVKVIRNNAVRPRAAGELENPLVEIGAMTFLHSPWAVFPVDLVAKLENVYQDPNYTYLVTEFCSEGELFKEVVQKKSLCERHVKSIALQLAIALFSLHKNGICHRDVSLENTLVQRDKSVRLIDFGQAEAIYDHAGNPKLMTGSAGKAYYRAPEMLRGAYYGPPVDVFALGVEIFIMAVGCPPWQKANLQDARYRNLTKCPTALDVALRKWGKRASLSDAFVDIVASIFCSEPNNRPTVEELLYHPWFAFDSTIWRWVHARKCSRTIRYHAERVERYLQLHPQGKYFERPCSVSLGAERPSLGAGNG